MKTPHVLLLTLLLIFPATQAKAKDITFTDRQICIATIATVMQKKPHIIYYDRTQKGIIFTHYQKDKKTYKQKCRIEDSQVIWGNKDGRWRDDSADPLINYKTEKGQLQIRQRFDDSAMKKSYKKSQIPTLWTQKYATKKKGNPIKIIKKALNAWKPLQITLKKGTLQVILDKNKIGKRTYKAVLTNSVCGSLWIGKKYWEGIKTIEILNKHSKQGYVFEGGEQDCAEMGEMAESEMYILEKTHTK